MPQAIIPFIPLIAAAVTTGAGAVISNQQNKAAKGQQNAYLAKQEEISAKNIAAAEAQRQADEAAAASEAEAAKQGGDIKAQQIAAAKARAAAGVGNAGVSPDFYTAMFSSQGYDNTTGAGGAP